MQPAPPYQPEGIHNFRAIAGYRLRGGGRFRADTVFRSGALELMTEADAAWLRDTLGLRTVLDLRHADDFARLPQEHGLADRVVNISIFDWPTGGAASVTAELDRLYGPGMSGRRYLHYLHMSGPQFARALRIFAAPESLPVLVHCAAGKDRTGVLLALVMDLAGVGEDDIAAEYGLSNASIDHLIRYLRSTGHAIQGSDDELRARMATPPEYMAEFMTQLRKKYGTAADFFQSEGVTAAELESVRANLRDAG